MGPDAAAELRERSPSDDVAPQPRRSRRVVRLWAGAVACACAAILAVAASLRPNACGFGTHQQLGFAPCGMILLTGYPCPTCGMTTAFAHTVRGRVGQALWAQPSGCLLALATMATLVASLATAATGRSPAVRWPVITPYRLVTLLVVVLLGGWVFKIAAGIASGTLPVHGVVF
jgi:hypothetical protein